MPMNIIHILLVLCYVCVTHSTELEDDHKKWLNRIQKHELIHVDLDMLTSNDIIEFDAFNNHYKVQLTINEGAVSTILHQNDDGSVTQQHPADDELCYFHGNVLNADSSRVALTLCEGKGIRGRIYAFGDTLYINPTNYYFAPYDDTKLSDEHLVYLSSDYDWESEEKDYGALGGKTAPSSDSSNKNEISTSNRRRLTSAGTVELMTVIDGNWVAYLGGSVSDAITFFNGVVNDASALYTANNLPSDVAVNIIHRWSIFANVADCTDAVQCTDDVRTFCSKYDEIDFDYGFYFKRVNGGGMSWTGATCGTYAIGESTSLGDSTRLAKVLAHELGHCLMRALVDGEGTHDPAKAWIMDYSGTGATWSDKSIAQLRKGRDAGIWDCLSTNDIGGTVTGHGNHENRLDLYTITTTTTTTTATPATTTTTTTATPSDLRYTHLGCYADSGTRALPYGPQSYGYTVDTCSTACASYRYFGLQAGGECFCGSDYNYATQYGAASNCASTRLGGYWAFDLFVHQYENIASNACIKLYDFTGDLAKLNGFWSQSYDGRYDQDGSDLYLALDGGYWKLNGKWDDGSCHRTDILDCEQEWVNVDRGVYNVGRFRSASGCQNAFSYPECFDDYENEMCFYRDSTSDAQRFELVEEEGCFNGAPVFRFIDDDADLMYYLHYGDDDEWVITVGEMSNYGEFMCGNANLYECIDGNWKHEVVFDDSISFQVADGVSIEGCAPAPESQSETGNKQNNKTKAIVIVILLVIVLVLVVGGCVLYKTQFMKKRKAIVKIDHESEDEVQEDKEAMVSTTVN